MFEYLINHEMSRDVFDSFQPKVDESAFILGTTDWKDFYGDIDEELPQGIPDPLGKIALTTCFVDYNHASNVVTRERTDKMFC